MIKLDESFQFTYSKENFLGTGVPLLVSSRKMALKINYIYVKAL
jgi:hypothetical protein